jgi:hypothetical protein
LPRGSSNETNWRRRSQPCGRALGEDAE